MTDGIVLIGAHSDMAGTILIGGLITHGGGHHTTTAAITAGMTLGTMAMAGTILGTTDIMVTVGMTLGGVLASIQVITQDMVPDSILQYHLIMVRQGMCIMENARAAVQLQTMCAGGRMEAI